MRLVRRRHIRLLVPLFLGGGLIAAIACGGETIVEKIVVQTVVVEKQVEKVVVQTVVVEKVVAGEKVVETVIVEKEKRVTVEVLVTPTAIPTATPVPLEPAPPPKNPSGVLTFAMVRITAGDGLNAITSPCEGWSVCEDLFAPTADSLVSARLAVDWEIASDVSSITINVRKGIQFNGGFGEVTAEDVAWSYNDANPAFNPASITDGGGLFSSFIGDQEVVVIDKYTVSIPVQQFDPRWQSWHFGQDGLGASVLSKAAYDQMGEAWMLENQTGSGPFTVSEWVENDRFEINAVDNHWRKTPQARTILGVAAPEQQTRLAMLRTGEADISEMSLGRQTELQQQGFTLQGAGLFTQMGVFFAGNLWAENHHITGEPLERLQVFVHDIPWIGNPLRPDDGNNPDGMNDMDQARLVREALAVAIDRELINEQILGGLGFPAFIEYFGSTQPEFKEEYKYQYSPARAKELLAEAGFPNGFSMPFYIGPEFGGGQGLNGEIGDAVAGFWDAIGVKTEVLKYAYQVWRPSVVGRSQTTPWITNCGFGKANYPWHWPRGLQMTSRTRGAFGCGFELPFVADRFVKVASEPDPEKRKLMNTEIAEYLRHWNMAVGVVAVPGQIVYNPSSISEWEMTATIRSAWNAPENIVPARR